MIAEIFWEARREAVREASRLTPEILAIDGLSDPKMRHLLNNVGRQVHTYLEVGCYNGSTLVAAAFRNPRLWALGIDNFSEDFPVHNGRGRPREQLPANLRRFAPHARFVEADFRALSPAALPVLDCVFYDGAHDRESQRQGVTAFATRFGPECLLLIDDWDLESARQGTRDGLDEVSDRLCVVGSTVLDDTWRGVGVFFLRRLS